MDSTTTTDVEEDFQIVRKAYVYLISSSETNSVYVGKALDPQARFNAHIKGAAKSNLPLYRAIMKYGAGTFTLKVLQECDSEDAAYFAETTWIKSFKSSGVHVFNLNEGGKGNHSPCAETRERMGAHQRGKSKTDEWKQKISQSLKGHVNSRESYERAARKLRGRKLSDEVRLKMSEGKKKSITDVFRKKIGDSKRGKHLSDETKRKLHDSCKSYDDDVAVKAQELRNSGMKIHDIVVTLNVSVGTLYRMFSFKPKK